MAKNKTEIHVTTVFDGELDATDVFVSLISQKYGKTKISLHWRVMTGMRWFRCFLSAVERLSEGIIFMCVWDQKKAQGIFW